MRKKCSELRKGGEAVARRRWPFVRRHHCEQRFQRLWNGER